MYSPLANGSDSTYCDKLYHRHNIDKNIKSTNGWSRVCKNGKILSYLHNCDKKKCVFKSLCECLTTGKCDISRPIGEDIIDVEGSNNE